MSLTNIQIQTIKKTVVIIYRVFTSTQPVVTAHPNNCHGSRVNLKKYTQNEEKRFIMLKSLKQTGKFVNSVKLVIIGKSATSRLN